MSVPKIIDMGYEFRTKDYLRIRGNMKTLRLGMTKQEAVDLVIDMNKIIRQMPSDHKFIFYTFEGEVFMYGKE